MCSSGVTTTRRNLFMAGSLLQPFTSFEVDDAMMRSVASQHTSFSDAATLRSASQFKGSTTGSFVTPATGSFVTPAREDGADATRSSAASSSAEPLLLDGAESPGLPMSGRYRFGYIAQYFAVGVVYGGLPATTYGFLLGYLNVPSYVYSRCTTMLTMPWSFKFAFGALNDCVPLCGYRRKPYMVFGWLLCSMMLLLLYLWPMPPPYYCIDQNTSQYLLDQAPCHPESAKAGAEPTVLMMGACLGYVIADVAADGLTVQYARLEPDARRGYTQSTAFLWRSLGQVVACSLVGFGMNGPLYLGSWQTSLSFSQICLIFAITAACMVPISLCCIDEKRLTERTSFAAYRRATWQLMRSQAFFCVVLWQLLNPAIQCVHPLHTSLGHILTPTFLGDTSQVRALDRVPPCPTLLGGRADVTEPALGDRLVRPLRCHPVGRARALPRRLLANDAVLHHAHPLRLGRAVCAADHI